MDEVLTIDPKMIVKLDSEKKTQTDILGFLADRLYHAGYVKKSYKAGILKREEVYPTGLLTGGINVAVPHTDCEHVNKAALAVAVLKEAVYFKAMDNPEREVGVSIVIMMALKEPHGQIEMLQKVLSLVKQQDELKTLLSTADENDIYQVIVNYLH